MPFVQRPQPRVRRDLFTTWLAWKTLDHRATNATTLGIDASFGIDDPEVYQRLSRLVSAVDDAGLLRLRDHRVELWPATDPDGEIEGHLLIVEFPDGRRAASHHLPIDHLIDDDLVGASAAYRALVNVAIHADELLIIHGDSARGQAAAAAPSAALAFPPTVGELPQPSLPQPSTAAPTAEPMPGPAVRPAAGTAAPPASAPSIEPGRVPSSTEPPRRPGAEPVTGTSGSDRSPGSGLVGGGGPSRPRR